MAKKDAKKDVKKDIVGIDSMILVYAGVAPSRKETRPKDFKDLHLRARILIAELADEGTMVVLPTIAVSELLVPVPEAQKGVLIAELNERFACQPFDLRASALAAELWARRTKLPKELQYTERHVLKADAMILAVAKVAGAKWFYSHDARCRKLAELIGMKGIDLPRHGQNLFVEGEIKRGER